MPSHFCLCSNPRELCFLSAPKKSPLAFWAFVWFQINVFSLSGVLVFLSLSLWVRNEMGPLLRRLTVSWWQVTLCTCLEWHGGAATDISYSCGHLQVHTDILGGVGRTDSPRGEWGFQEKLCNSQVCRVQEYPEVYCHSDPTLCRTTFIILKGKRRSSEQGTRWWFLLVYSDSPCVECSAGGIWLTSLFMIRGPGFTSVPKISNQPCTSTE